MKRYQLYLDPYSVSVIDDFEKISNISRSKLIREVVDRFAQDLTKVLVKSDAKLQKRYTLDNLVGMIDLKTKKKTDYSMRADDAYLKD